MHESFYLVKLKRIETSSDRIRPKKRASTIKMKGGSEQKSSKLKNIILKIKQHSQHTLHR